MFGKVEISPKFKIRGKKKKKTDVYDDWRTKSVPLEKWIERAYLVSCKYNQNSCKIQSFWRIASFVFTRIRKETLNLCRKVKTDQEEHWRQEDIFLWAKTVPRLGEVLAQPWRRIPQRPPASDHRARRCRVWFSRLLGAALCTSFFFPRRNFTKWSSRSLFKKGKKKSLRKTYAKARCTLEIQWNDRNTLNRLQFWMFVFGKRTWRAYVCKGPATRNHPAGKLITAFKHI